jgi:hypothetical protein
MGVKNYIPTHGINLTRVINLEKQLLQRHFAFLDITIHNGTLICRGFCQPTEYSVRYEYKVKFIPNQSPKVYVVEPQITYHKDIHMYSDDNRLCLYYPKDYSYNNRSHLYETIIPWTHEWFVFYELYQVTGKWLHPFVEHNKI